MYTKENLIASIKNDFRIIKHLVEKITPEMLSYRPTEKQRSTLELLQYTAVAFSLTAQAIYKNNTDVYAVMKEQSEKINLENFNDMLDIEEKEIIDILNQSTDEEMGAVINMYNQGEKTRAVYFVESLLKWIPAYKMQLFLYMKANGIHHIGTSNLWGGVDMPPKE